MPQLKLAALIYLSYADREIAIPLLIKSLKDEDWHVKVVALTCLGKLKVNEAIPDIAHCLKDSNYTVVLVAKHELHELGEQVLKSHNIDYKPMTLDVENQFMLI